MTSGYALLANRKTNLHDMNASQFRNFYMGPLKIQMGNSILHGKMNTTMKKVYTNFRNLPTRIVPSRKLEIATPILRQPIYSKVRNPAPMFRTTSAPFSSDREKRRMHFISTEWKSEGVSWMRFHKTDLKDIHKLGWI